MREEKNRTKMRTRQKTQKNTEITRISGEILLSSSAGSGPLCEMANERTPVLQPVVIDSGAAETRRILSTKRNQ